jgi:thiol-disulfide isomerase/thioredoxin
MRISILSISLLMASFIHAQQRIAVPLKTVKGVQPFSYSVATTNIQKTNETLPAGVSSYLKSNAFKGLPSDINTYRIKEFNLVPSAQKLFIFYGITKANKRVVLIDANGDHDFTGEKPYYFDTDITYTAARHQAILDTITSVELKVESQPSVNVFPNILNCCITYSDPMDSTWHLFISTGNHKEGSFVANNKAYHVALSESNSPFTEKDKLELFINSKEQAFKRKSNTNQPYKFKQEVHINGETLYIDSINRLQDTIWITYNGYNIRPQGFRQELYAQNIMAKPISGPLFNLHQLKGKYVLLDFWGTWCAPCIDLLPKLQELYKQHTAKGLVMVSIANDKKESYAKLQSMIQEYGMDWTQLFDDQEQAGNISTQYDVTCFPTSILINPEGKIIFRSCGKDDFKRLESIIKEVIQ